MCALSPSTLTPPMGSVSYVATPPVRSFYRVGGAELSRMSVVTEIFNRILVPLYGSQDKAIRQIAEGRDRACFLMYEGERAVGVLVFKTELSNEFSAFGVDESVEIKSLFIDHAVKNSGRGLGSALVDKLLEEVRNLELGEKNIHVTVSETKEESLSFFQKKGFRIVHKWEGRYLKGFVEYLLARPVSRREDLSLLERAPAVVPSGEGAPELLDIIHDAHMDDIQTLTRLSDHTFVSGGKDNCLYKWSFTGARLRIVDEIEPTQRSDRNWITAAASITDSYWVSGERSGTIALWRTNGLFVKEIYTTLPRLKGHVSAPENMRRVASLAKGLSESAPSFLVGFPTMFSEFNLIEGRTVCVTTVHINDWVYCIHPFSDRRALLAIGGKVEIWEKSETWEWSRFDRFLEEERKVPSSKHRVFISKILPIGSEARQVAFSLFNGRIKVLDLETKRTTQVMSEHSGRVWTLEKADEHLFVSCGEDKTIRLWDTRLAASVKSLERSIEAMSLLSLDPHRFVAGTAAIAGRGSQLCFYDLRRMPA